MTRFDLNDVAYINNQSRRPMRHLYGLLVEFQGQPRMQRLVQEAIEMKRAGRLTHSERRSRTTTVVKGR